MSVREINVKFSS